MKVIRHGNKNVSIIMKGGSTSKDSCCGGRG